MRRIWIPILALLIAALAYADGPVGGGLFGSNDPETTQGELEVEWSGSGLTTQTGPRVTIRQPGSPPFVSDETAPNALMITHDAGTHSGEWPQLAFTLNQGASGDTCNIVMTSAGGYSTSTGTQLSGSVKYYVDPNGNCILDERVGTNDSFGWGRNGSAMLTVSADTAGALNVKPSRGSDGAVPGPYAILIDNNNVDEVPGIIFGEDGRIFFFEGTDLASAVDSDYDATANTITASAGTPFSSVNVGDWIFVGNRNYIFKGAATQATTNLGHHLVTAKPGGTGASLTVTNFTVTQTGKKSRVFRSHTWMEPDGNGGMQWVGINQREFYVGDSGGDAAETTLSLNNYDVMTLSLTETYDKAGNWTTTANEVCYTGLFTKQFLISVPISFDRTTGAGTDIITFAFGKNTTGNIDDGSEFGDEFQRTASAADIGMGAVSATASFATDDCVSLMAKVNDTTGGSGWTMEAASLTITEP